MYVSLSDDYQVASSRLEALTRYMQVDAIKYKDKVREKARLARLASKAQPRPPTSGRHAPPVTKPWSLQTARKETRILRREKKVKKREAIARAAVNGGGKGKKRVVDADEWKELQDEVRLIKKIKKGLVTEESDGEAEGHGG
ncbi:hypothetical protein SeLEV6574_g07063 [Synchytrium endobioticum]|uniref:ATP-dependent rRNA helicase SPB4-like C-terminal tail domain-containing protein n=1 Tax=Synchytrium endobioticum TaxID=286115 RepID=A0A507CLP2_9FUNG|nr:hypothetical protein SeLEV6574_g07063 [Synchytrium endobioticum]